MCKEVRCAGNTVQQVIHHRLEAGRLDQEKSEANKRLINSNKVESSRMSIGNWKVDMRKLEGKENSGYWWSRFQR